MAYRCKTCGYRFKKGDSDLCPECFTARDDIDCGSFEKGHTHFKDTEKEANDFISEQIKEEKKQSFDDEYKANGNVRGYNSTNYQTGYRANTPPPTNTGSTIRSNYNGGKSTLKYTTSFTPYQTQQTYNNSSAGSPYVTNKKVSVKHKPGCFIAFIIFFIFISPFSAIISGIYHFIKDAGESNEYHTTNPKTIYNETEGFYIDNSDGDVTVYVNGITPFYEYSSLNEVMSDDYDLASVSGVSDDLYDEAITWQKIYADIYLGGNTSYYITNISFAGNDENGEEFYSCSPYVFTSEDVPYCFSTPLLICEKALSYDMLVTISDGDESETITIEMDSTQIDEQLAISETDYSNDVFDYDLSIYPTSLKDSNGKNLELKCLNYENYEILPEDVMSASETVYDVDDRISDTGWLYAQFELTKADSSKEPLGCEYISVTLNGWDPDGETLYYYLSGDSDRILLNEAVELYVMSIEYIDKLGETQNCTFLFSLDEFSESI